MELKMKIKSLAAFIQTGLLAVSCSGSSTEDSPQEAVAARSGEPSTLISKSYQDSSPILADTGSILFFSSGREQGVLKVYLYQTNQTTGLERVSQLEADTEEIEFVVDENASRAVLLGKSASDGSYSLVSVDIATKVSTVITTTTNTIRELHLSTDGTWLSHVEIESNGTSKVVIRNLVSNKTTSVADAMLEANPRVSQLGSVNYLITIKRDSSGSKILRRPITIQADAVILGESEEIYESGFIKSFELTGQAIAMIERISSTSSQLVQINGVSQLDTESEPIKLKKISKLTSLDLPTLTATEIDTSMTTDIETIATGFTTGRLAWVGTAAYRCNQESRIQFARVVSYVDNNSMTKTLIPAMDISESPALEGFCDEGFADITRDLRLSELSVADVSEGAVPIFAYSAISSKSDLEIKLIDSSRFTTNISANQPQ